MLLGVIRRMCRREIPRTGEAKVGKEMVGRDQCLVRELEMEETGFGFRRSLRILRRVRLVWRFLALRRRVKASKTQRDLILEAVEALKALLGQGGRFDSGAHSSASPG